MKFIRLTLEKDEKIRVNIYKMLDYFADVNGKTLVTVGTLGNRYHVKETPEEIDRLIKFVVSNSPVGIEDIST